MRVVLQTPALTAFDTLALTGDKARVQAWMGNSEAQFDLKTCSVFELYARGLRVLADYDELKAVRHYCMLHLGADEKALWEELSRDIERCREAAG